jgi:probable phosphoglycerate mutase
VTRVPRSPATTLWLARHGQSTWNATGRWQGQADPPLSELGEEQAGVAARWLAASSAVELVVASDLRRATQTAERIAAELGVDLELEPRVRERHAGEWTGLTREEIEAGWPGWLADHRRPPGFEADDALLHRVVPALTELIGGRAGARVLVVTHGGVVRTVERHLGVEAPPVPNLGAREVVATGTRWQAGERMLLLDGHGEGDGFVTVPAQI